MARTLRATPGPLGEKGNMEYTQVFDGDSGICTLSVTGDFVRPEDALEVERLTANLHDELGCRRFLIDMTKARIFSSTMSTFTASNPPEELRVILRKVRVAALYTGLSEDHRFLETVAVNRGLTLRVFDERDEAIRWLTR
jgi:hypothetical protein